MSGEVFLAGTASPASGPNTFAIANDTDLFNGARTVATKAARNAIATGLLTAGAVVNVVDSDGSGTFAAFRYLGGTPTLDANWAFYIDPGVTPVDASPTISFDNTMATIVLADNTVYSIQIDVTARDTGNLVYSAYHSQKWTRTGGGVATLSHLNDPTATDAIGIGLTASRLVASTNNVLLKFNPVAITTRYHADIYVRSVALAHA